MNNNYLATKLNGTALGLCTDATITSQTSHPCQSFNDSQESTIRILHSLDGVHLLNRTRAQSSNNCYYTERRRKILLNSVLQKSCSVAQPHHFQRHYFEYRITGNHFIISNFYSSYTIRYRQPLQTSTLRKWQNSGTTLKQHLSNPCPRPINHAWLQA